METSKCPKCEQIADKIFRTCFVDGEAAFWFDRAKCAAIITAELARLKSDKEAAERERDEAKERVNVIQEAYDRDTAKLQQEIQRLSAANSGVYWRWQGDGGDYLESLTCPILIDVGQLKDIFDKGAAWHDALTLCRIELAYLIEQLPLRGLGVSSVQSAYDAATAALLPPAKEVEGV